MKSFDIHHRNGFDGTMLSSYISIYAILCFIQIVKFRVLNFSTLLTHLVREMRVDLDFVCIRTLSNFFPYHNVNQMHRKMWKKISSWTKFHYFLECSLLEISNELKNENTHVKKLVFITDEYLQLVLIRTVPKLI